MSGVLDALVSIALFIVVLGVLVLFHELGHFVTARLSRVRVLEFGFGFPPRAKLLSTRGETQYTLNWLPIGGFVKLEGEDGDANQDPRSFTRAALWKKLLILLMGVVMNLVLAVAIFGGIALVGAPHIGVRFEAVDPGSPAAAAGLLPTDTIASIDGRSYDFYGSLYGDGNIVEQLRAHAGQTIQLGVVHADGSPATLAVTLRSQADIDAGKGALGVKAGPDGFEPVVLASSTSRPLDQSLSIGWQETTRWFGAIVDALGQLGSSIVNHPTEAPPVSGPVGIAGELGKTFHDQGPVMTLYVMAILSANLALVNVLPFPPLDGGRMLVIVLKAIPGLGRKISQRAEQMTYAIGFLALFGFLIWVTFFDIARGLTGGGQ